MLLPRPKPKWKRLLETPEVYKSADTIITALVGGGIGVGLKNAGLEPLAVLAWLGTAAATGLKIIGGVVSITKAAQRENVEELEGCLETLVSIVNPPDSDDYDPGFRATLHVSVNRGKEFVQVVDYVGDDRAGKTAGRKFRGDAGLAAKVLSDGEAYAASRDFPNHERYVQELVSYWGYDENEARSKDMSAMSWMAVPLADSAGVVGGVLFTDSTKLDFFDDPYRQRVLLTSAIGIAKFAVRRYTH
jgi:hypothetical protein